MEEKIHEMKDWSDIKSHDSWEIFKIMSEFVEGFERLSRIGPCVSIFGSAKTELDNKYYKLAEELAFQLTQCVVLREDSCLCSVNWPCLLL